MLVRHAIPADVPRIIALEQQAQNAAHWSEREYTSIFDPEAPERLALLACDESHSAMPIGFLVARTTQDEWEIENIIIDASHRRSGVASRLLREITKRAARRGVTSVLLEVRESNIPARKLYENFGFIEDGRRCNYYRDPAEDALLLRFVLHDGDKPLEPE